MRSIYKIWNKNLAVAIVILFSGSICEAQTIQFQKILSSNYSVGSAFTDKTFDGGYIVVADVADSNSNSILAVKMDHLGNIEWSKIYKAQTTIDPMAVKTIGADDIIISSMVSGCGSGQSDVSILDINYGGVIKWTKTFGDSIFDAPFGIAATSDHGCIIVGTTDSYNTTENWFATRIDSVGNIVWSKLINYNSGVNTIHIANSIDGNFLLTGSVGDNVSTSFDMVLIKIDPIGNIMWSRSYDSNYDDDGSQLVQDTDGNIYVGGSRSFLAMFGEITITRFNSIGNKIWTRSFGGPNNEWARGLCMKDHILYAVGQTASYANSLMIVACDTSGNLIHEKIFAGFDFSAITSENDLGILATSPKYNWNSGMFDLLIVKTDTALNSGCFENTAIDTATNYSLSSLPLSLNISNITPAISNCPIQMSTITLTDSSLCYAVGVKELNIDSSFDLFPNPTNDILFIDYKQTNLNTMMEVYDITGKKLFSNRLESFGKNSITVKELSDGLYFIRIIDGDMIYSKKFIKE